MTTAFFIADIHAGIDNPRRRNLAISFFDLVIRERGSLYILGDLFDFWANNRQLVSSHLAVFSKLGEFQAHGLTAGLLIGNRDFLLSRKTMAACGVDFLGEEAEIALDTKRIFLAHGHTLCLADTQFLKYKQRMWPLFRILDRLLPGSIENWIARQFIFQSKKVINAQDPARFAFTREAIDRLFAAGIDVVICGHTHKPEQYQAGKRRFFALPAWDDAAGHYLLYRQGDFSLHQFTQVD